MPSAFWVVTPSSASNAQLAIAASRAGETGLLDLGWAAVGKTQLAAVASLKQEAHSDRWGVRVEALGDSADPLTAARSLSSSGRLPLLVLAGLDSDEDQLRELKAAASELADLVYLEVYSLCQAQVAERAGFDGLLLKGNEAAGRVSDESSFLLLQQLHGRITIPYVVQGGIGPDTAAAAFLAGAAGVVLREQVWLTRESPFDDRQRQRWAALDGSETVTVSGNGHTYRFFGRADRASVSRIDRLIAEGSSCLSAVESLARGRISEAGNDSPSDELLPLGQEIAFAANLAKRYGTVGALLQAMNRRMASALRSAKEQNALAPNAPLAKSHGIKYPILQGPMTRVSDVSPFCRAVADNGALPFLALALLRGPEVRQLLVETKDLMGDLPWGVGILGFVPAELRKEQLEVIREICPPYAIIAGGRPSQAQQLEQLGIVTYLHVPSPGLLASFVADGARRFIFEGRECGGHVGPRSSFTLWQSAIDVLLQAEVAKPEELHIVFAGGIHDALSTAMVAALAAPLVARGMKIGVLMGTAYLFTAEGVASGAITEEFQRQAVECRETILLESGIGHATRCVPSPFAHEFIEARHDLIRDGKTSDEIRLHLEILNIGRLRLAAKGVDRRSAAESSAKGELYRVDEATQRDKGMFMIGQVAMLRDRVLSMAELHSDVSVGGVECLNQLAALALTERVNERPAKPEGEDIAIVGIGCMFPQSRNLREYWQNIVRGFNAIREVPADRWRAEDFYSSDRTAPDKVNSKWGAFLEDVFFDPLKYHIPPASLASIEPIQLLSLEVALQALQDAGYHGDEFGGERTSVIFGVSCVHDRAIDYAFRTMIRHFLPQVDWLSVDAQKRILDTLDEKLPAWTEDSFAGYLGNVIAGRISNRLNLRGSNFVVDAACAASLAALHAAVQELRTYSCDVAVAGAADGTNNPFVFMSFAKTHALTSTGQPRPFDDSADGIALGEGVAALVLKRLADAERDGDQIYAVIKGIGSSSDGRNRSLTAPHPQGQMSALERAYEDAGFDPKTVTLVEAHGTGTAVGDRTEIQSLQAVFSAHGSARQSCAIGSVKSMIGHTKTAAGMASLIKSALALKHRLLPPTIGVSAPNRQIDFASSPFYVNSEARPWIGRNGAPARRAGLSAFGFGGTNFHVVLEEYAGGYHTNHEFDLTARAAELFVWKRRDAQQLGDALRSFQRELDATPNLDLARLGRALVTDEAARPADDENRACRLAVVASSIDDLRQKLEQAVQQIGRVDVFNNPSGIYYSATASLGKESVCFLFPGQGSQSVNMLRDLALGTPGMLDLFEQADEALRDFLPDSLSRYIYPVPTFDAESKQHLTEQLNDTRVAQPALGVTGLFGAKLLDRFGLVPATVAGHSYGEYVALCVAGAFSEDDLFRLSAERGRIVHGCTESCPGAMAAVFASAESTSKAVEMLKLPVTLANLNSPDQTIIAGPIGEIEKAVEKLNAAGLRAKRIPVTAAFHTPAMAPAGAQLAEHLQAVEFQPLRLPVSSNATAGTYPTAAADIRELLVRHLTSPVLFENQVRALYASGIRAFLEVGPGAVLTGLVGRTLNQQPHTAIPLDAPGRGGWLQLAHLLAQCAAIGLPVKVATWFEQRRLPALGVAKLCEQTRRDHQRKPTDWVVNGGRARPWAQVASRPAAIVSRQSTVSVESLLRDPPAVSSHDETPQLAAPSSNGSHFHESHHMPVAPATGSSTTFRENGMSSQPTNGDLGDQHVPALSPRISPASNGNHLPAIAQQAPASLHALAHFQANMAQWLDLQKNQQCVSQQFLLTQEKVMLAFMQGASAVEPTTFVEAPRKLPAATSPSLRVAPSQPTSVSRPAASAPISTGPVAPRVPVTPTTLRAQGAAQAPTAQLKTPFAPPAVGAKSSENGSSSAAAPKTAAPATAGPPSTDQFRRDLLESVSQRTGYPIEMLNEELPLEAGLGIDSIKTLEVFNSLKLYHPFFRDDDEQEQDDVLAEFAQLKTLGKIIEAYDLKSKRFLNPTTKSVPAEAPRKNAASAVHDTLAHVERFEVAAVQAALSPESLEKKNSLNGTSS